MENKKGKQSQSHPLSPDYNNNNSQNNENNTRTYNTESFINNYLDRSYYTGEQEDSDNNMRSPYYSSDSINASPEYPQPRNINSNLNPDYSKNRKNTSRGNYPDSENDSVRLSDNNTTRSSMNQMPHQGLSANLDLYGALRNPKLSDSRYASYAPSTESLLALIENKKPQYGMPSVSSFSRASSWVTDNNNANGGYFDLPGNRALTKDYPWPAWIPENQVPITKEEIFEIFEDLGTKFGFQKDNYRNQYDAFMTLLDSRASRMTPTMALLTVHADYIGGKGANYRKWFFAAEFNKDSVLNMQKSSAEGPHNNELEAQLVSDSLEEWWRNKMSKLTQVERVRQVALYLLIWGEALNVRYLPEAICFIYKTAYDYYNGDNHVPAEEGDYLKNVIKPLYTYIRDQNYEIINGQYVKKDKDHAQTIGYDDINETFWTKEGINQLLLSDKKTKLMSLAPNERYLKFQDIDYKRSFKKTYFERRTWLHLLTNFSRIWIFHVSVFYFFWMFNSPFLFISKEDQVQNISLNPSFEYNTPRQLSCIGLGGALASFIALLGTMFEFQFAKKSWKNTKILLKRTFMLTLLLIANIVPTAIVFLMFNCEANPEDTSNEDTQTQKFKNCLLITKIISGLHIAFGVATTAFLVTIPPSYLFQKKQKLTLANSKDNGLTNRAFTADFADLGFTSRATSISMWALIGLCKIVESYLALILSFKNAFRALVYLDFTDCTDPLAKGYLCHQMGYITIVVMLMVLLIMFFLDTYLWYIIITSLFSIAQAFSMGISILSPWKNIFSRLPKRIYTKILATSNMEIKLRPKMLCSQVWNAVIISMYRDHLISIDHVQKLLYQQVPSDIEGRKKLKPPTFFVAQEDTSANTEFYPPGSEAERRISFFASSLSTVIPEPLPVENMPTFTVFTPHYAEKILLSLREIIREDDQYTRVTLLEYLKSLYAVEWDHFVKDTKILAEETSLLSENPPFGQSEEEVNKTVAKSKTDDLPFYCIGFKSAAPEFTLRTRIWASLRSQTLYRTISGFMNYSKALKLLHRIENPELVHILGGNTEALEQELDLMSKRKFSFLISMQRYTKFNKEEKENVEFLLKTYPDLQIAYLDEVASEIENEPPVIYSCLIDGHCEVDDNGNKIPKYRIQIPGNPILGDGKSDNQNHSIIFTRGEYLQVIDANQDNYLEEALKIRSVLAEFEEYQAPQHSPYSPQGELNAKSPVAIVGAREYIFSENIGILGDIAAGKEQTFGTLTHRILADVGGRLHYGHPDFLNMVFMNTRGGVSKAQKGLHLNEDIYAGMNAVQRGGRVKHSEYIQCGKGRDLGFCSVLNFSTKIGTGMGEQMLAREYYYLFTQLPLDRFLTLFYAHPGFHVNNMMIMLSIQVFLLATACIGVLFSVLPKCPAGTEEGTPISATEDCFNRLPITKWIERTITSVFLVFFITFLPLILQVLSEQGFVRMAARLGKQVASMAPMFEIFTTQIYSNSILTNLSFGGARYIGTGRGFATARQQFSILFSRFASSSIYSGMRNFLILTYVCATLWVPQFLYFWFTVLGLTLSPWIFNPHQFSKMDFILDYRQFLHWMSTGNSQTAKDSWVSYCRYARTRVTGVKRKKLGDKERKIAGYVPRAHRMIIFFSEVLSPFITAFLTIAVYSVLGSYASVETEDENGRPGADSGSGILRAAIIALIPVGGNALILLILFPVSLFLGPVMSVCFKQFGNLMSAIAHCFSVIMLVISFVFILLLENWYYPNAILGITAAMFLQRAILSTLTFLFLTREFGHDGANVAWWTGKWFSQGLGWMAITQPMREYVCKIIELCYFAADYIIAHMIIIVLFPFCLIPYIDKWHSMMLFWLRPSRQIRPPIFSLRQRAQRKRASILYGIILALNIIFFLLVIVAPAALETMLAKSVGRKKFKDILKPFKL